MKLYRDEGVVLRTIRLGEADRIVTIMTRDHGKVRAVAKGVRRTTSRFGARLEPFSHLQLQCWRGRDLDTVTQVEVLDPFRKVREDLSRVGKAFALAEAVDKLALEHHEQPRLFHMLVGALRALERSDSALIVPAFFLKALALEGTALVLGQCASCGVADGLAAFDMGQGGALCRGCRRGRAVSGETLEVFRRMLGGALGAVLEESFDEQVEREVTAVATEALEWHVERRLRSVRAVTDLGRRSV